MKEKKILKMGTTLKFSSNWQKISLAGVSGKCTGGLRIDGHPINHKRFYRIYVLAKLTMGRKTRKRIPARIKQPLVQPLCPNLMWSMDFMRDSLFQGKPFRAFNVIDDFNREALNITIAKSITCERVIMELGQLISWRGRP
jgi:putative transposase